MSRAPALGRGYVEKYDVRRSRYHVLRSLTYFEDAEKDPAYPAGLEPTEWETIKAFFAHETPALLT